MLVYRAEDQWIIGYGLLLVDDPRDRRQLIRAGRVLQRLHLAATVRWLAVQHMNQISERVDRDRSLGREPRFADCREQGMRRLHRSACHAVPQGATEAEAADAIGVPFLMNGGPATVYGAGAFDAFREFYEQGHEQRKDG
jgi:hypothetical protein